MGEPASDEIAYTRHLRTRLELRRFSPELPRKIFEAADRRYLDEETGHIVAVKQVRLRGRAQLLMIAYDRTQHGIEIVTIHPISKQQEKSRTKGGRWTRLGREVS